MEKTLYERMNESYTAKVEPLKTKKAELLKRISEARLGLGKHEKMTAAQISELDSQRVSATAKGEWSQVEEIEAGIDKLRQNDESSEQILEWKADLGCLSHEITELEKQMTLTAKTILIEFMPQAQEEVFDAFEAWLVKADSTWDSMKKFAAQVGIEVGNNRELLIPKDSQMYGNRSKLLYNWACHWGY